MSANTGRSDQAGPDRSDQKASEEAADFESGLDYGAFAEDAPDYPEDRLGDKDSAAEAAPVESSASTSSDEEPTAAVPRASEQETRALNDAAAEASEDSEPAQPTQAVPASGTAASASSRSRHAGDVEPGREEDDPRRPGRHARKAEADVESGTELSADRSSTEPFAPSAAGTTRDTTQDITDQDLAEEVAKDKRGVSRFLQVLIAIFFPVLVIAATIRLVASPVFLWIAYNRPGFPEDDFGFSTADRLVYGSYGMDFLFNASNSRYLAELAPGGEELFTEAEVGHMADVKLVMVYTMTGGAALLLLTLLFALLLRRWRPGGFARGVFAGSWATLGVIGAVAVLAVLNWQQFFDSFHRVFFAEGTWTFTSDSTLIRLYPGQFWIDAGIATAALVILISLLAIIITWPTRRRRERRRQRLQEVYDKRREKLVAELTKEAEYSNVPR